MDLMMVPAHRLVPNPWNPNAMDPEMFQRAMESIRDFGFVDPITVRATDDGRFEIIDGEHRWKAGILDHTVVNEDGVPVIVRKAMAEFPCINLGFVEDDVAMQLTIVLNETRGSANRDRLAKMMIGLRERIGDQQIARVLPFSRERLADLLDERRTAARDFTALGSKDGSRPVAGGAANLPDPDRPSGGWVERVFRLPREVAVVVDEALDKAKNENDTEQTWQALEVLAAEYLASP